MVHDRRAIAQAYRDAADALESGELDGECCGIPLSEIGACQHRGGHPTVGHVAIIDYPEYYDYDGHLIG